MFNAMIGIGFLSGIVYGIWIDGTFFKIYFTILALYTIVFNNLLINKKQTTKRKNIAATSWCSKY
jgi:Ca2+/Na+ antiporter